MGLESSVFTSTLALVSFTTQQNKFHSMLERLSVMFRAQRLTSETLFDFKNPPNINLSEKKNLEIRNNTGAQFSTPYIGNVIVISLMIESKPTEKKRSTEWLATEHEKHKKIDQKSPWIGVKCISIYLGLLKAISFLGCGVLGHRASLSNCRLLFSLHARYYIFSHHPRHYTLVSFNFVLVWCGRMLPDCARLVDSSSSCRCFVLFPSFSVAILPFGAFVFCFVFFWSDTLRIVKNVLPARFLLASNWNNNNGQNRRSRRLGMKWRSFGGGRWDTHEQFSVVALWKPVRYIVDFYGTPDLARDIFDYF